MQKKITVLKNGPYKVEGNVPLIRADVSRNEAGYAEKWSEGEEYSACKGTYCLCRCGRSANKPFCDGSHVKNGFRGNETGERAPEGTNVKYYSGPELDLVDDESLCALLQFCDRGATIWDAVEDSGEPFKKELALNESCCCASGRLTVVAKDGTPYEPELPQEISPTCDKSNGYNGPLWVKGGIPVENQDGKKYKIRNRMTLCRCGESANMPFCDGSHTRCPHMKL